LSGGSLLSQDKLQSQFETLLDDRFIADEPGGTVLVTKNMKAVFSKSYGVADLGTGEKITEKTVFNTGSISKTFVSNAILILAERGLLSLNDPITKYFKDFNNKSVVEHITIKHLLSHTSGLPDLRDIEGNTKYYLSAKDYENFQPLKQVETLNFEPGERFKYSNPSFNGLALIVEKVSNQKWQDFVKMEILEPSSMSSSTITDGPHPETGVAHAYVMEGGKFIESDYGEVPTFAAAGNGGIWCSVLDLARYENAIQLGKFLGEGLILESRTVYYPNLWSEIAPPFVGYSWFLGEKSLFDQETKLGVDIIYHTGSQGGFRAFYVSIPEKEILFVGLYNRPMENMDQLIFLGLSILQENNWLQ